MLVVNSDIEKISNVIATINTVARTLETDRNINDVVKAAHAVLAQEFNIHMSARALSQPKRFKHMYEWDRVGDPLGKLWKHVLRGQGSKRTASFVFTVSRRAVPIQSELRAVGVKTRHVFRWKAPIIEYGLPVNISRKTAQKLVYIAHNFGRKMVFSSDPVKIDRQGNKFTWGSFTKEFAGFWTSSKATKALNKKLLTPLKRHIETEAVENIRKGTRKTSKDFKIDVMPFDQTFARKLSGRMRTMVETIERGSLT